jgi:2-hydroxychromene-2-carboxylate isomerase
MPRPTLEFFYDFSCPYAYLASTRVAELAKRAGAELVYKPFLLGGVFRAIGAPDMAAMAAPRARLNVLDMRRWAEHWDVPLRMPAGHPRRSVLALRAALASGALERATPALFRAYWIEARDVSDAAVVQDALDRAGFDGAELVRRAEQPNIKDELFARTDEAVGRGVFGAPALFVGDQMFWGQDRLDFVERALGLETHAPAPPPAPHPARLEFCYDFSSPFAYLASTQVERVAREAGAELVWRPFLLGALFREIGTPNVPLLSFAEAKQRYLRLEMQRFAELYGVPFRFPSRFPMKTVTALRMALGAGDAVARLTHALFRAYWVDDRDLNDAAELARICREAGVDPKLVDEAGSDALRDALRRSTDEARERGLCGAPSFVVGDLLFWGQDRLPFVEKALRGWRPKAG